jgi:NAD(P)-dependent dehydrogenase (short-subunit alcohol dehydrogenase family)
MTTDGKTDTVSRSGASISSAEDMKRVDRLRIIVVCSPALSNPPANRAPYTIGKSAQEALMLTLAEELKYTGVTANILRVRTIDVQHERVSSLSPENVFWTTPEEIGSAIEYLCSDEGAVVNGVRLPLYGSP